MIFKNRRAILIIMISTLFSFIQNGCKKNDQQNTKSTVEKLVIQNIGSDTIVNLAQAWAEEYAKINPLVSIEVSGGGSGTGIAALVNNTADIANCSRQMVAEEVERVKNNTGKEQKEFVVGYDGLAVYVHKNNPLDKISIEQLAEIYGEGGNITSWPQLGIDNVACSGNKIIRVSRQSNSGTYYYFREALLGDTRDFKLGSNDLNGSKEVVELVGKTPCSIGYSGMGYRTEQVKMLSISKKIGDTAFKPNVESVLNGTYPIARPLYMYTIGEPTGEIKKYIEWILSDSGQQIVEENGYVPLPKEIRSGTDTIQ